MRQPQPTRNAIALRRARTRARANGRCIVCRLEPVDPGKTCCPTCRAKTKARRAANRLGGKCVCGRQPEPGYKTCRECIEAAAARQTIAVAVSKANGMCTYCHVKPAAEGKQQCQKHLDYFSRKQRRRYRRLRG